TATLTVVRIGDGLVTSMPTGLSCGEDCAHAFSAPTVTLTATPGPASDPVSWSGAGCSGSGSCVGTLDRDPTVTAKFTLKPTGPELAPTDSDFGAAVLGADGAAKTFTVHNDGGAPSGSLSASVNSPSYVVTGGSCAGMALPPGADCTVIVTFRPMGSGG